MVPLRSISKNVSKEIIGDPDKPIGPSIPIELFDQSILGLPRTLNAISLKTFQHLL